MWLTKDRRTPSAASLLLLLLLCGCRWCSKRGLKRTRSTSAITIMANISVMVATCASNVETESAALSWRHCLLAKRGQGRVTEAVGRGDESRGAKQVCVHVNESLARHTPLAVHQAL